MSKLKTENIVRADLWKKKKIKPLFSPYKMTHSTIAEWLKREFKKWRNGDNIEAETSNRHCKTSKNFFFQIDTQTLFE